LQFTIKVLALTSRVTKLGTLVAWADGFNLVDDYLMAVHRRLTSLDTNVRFDQLVKMADSTLKKYNNDAWKEHKLMDQRSPSCWPDQVSNFKAF